MAAALAKVYFPWMTEHARERQRDAPRVFTIPPGAPFLPTFVAALLDGRLVPGFSAAVGPLALADATIFVPTRRSARALAAAFAERLEAAGTFLPRILPLGDLDAIETDALLDSHGLAVEDPAGPVAIDPLARRMILTRLILAWAASVRHAVLTASAPDGEGASGEALLVATSPVDAWHLSGELAALLDEFILAGLDWRALAPLGTEAFDRYWGITLDFLKIATEHWPAILADRGQIDPATRHKQLIESDIARMGRSGHGSGPVIVAGATGADPLTARLIAAIARLPQGAVVLPGLDQELDEASWALLGGAADGHGHSQALLHRVLSAVGVARQDVVPLGTVPPPLAARSRLVSEALRPAETTDVWHRVAEDATLDRAAALDQVSIIEAADEGEEALALAIALRETLEGQGSAVLVTPDRTLARRVREELVRWGIEIDDSGGEPLATTAAGALARLAIECVTSDLDPVPALALLTHPAVRLGRPRDTVARLSRFAELFLLRRTLRAGALSEPAPLIAEARERAAEENAPAALKRLTEQDFVDLQDLLASLLAALSPLRALDAATELGTWVAAHEDTVAALAKTEAGASALGGVDGTRLASLFGELIAAAEPAITLDRTSYAALFQRIAAETAVRGPARSHPRLKILGLLEMRLLGADRVLLGGLDEAIWPPQVKTDAFLNRPMRSALGLAPPERRIGQTAHDFEMALGQPEVILSRARKRGGSPTVPSRFLQRLAAVAGENWRGCQARGRVHLDFARALDGPDRAVAIGRPNPKPPVDLRPTKLSVTRVETLRRDPYAIYADKILRLRPLDPVGATVGPREWGTAFHGVLRAFIDRVRHESLPPDALAELLRDARDVFAPFMEEPHVRAFLAPRVDRWVRGFHGWEQSRRAGLSGIHAEAEGRLTIPLLDGTVFELTATADRIELDGSGAVRLIDYKTGAAPTKKEVAAGFAPQLTLEAAIALAKGFKNIDAVTALDEALYVKFGTGRELAVTRLAWDDRSLAEVAAEHLEGLRDLLNAFRDPTTGYMARPYPQFLARYSDYDHLSRVKEWSATGGLGDPAAEGGE